MNEFDEIDNRHAYHQPTNPAIAELHQQIREHTHDLAEWLVGQLPESREKAQALTDVDNAMLHANAAVARHMNG